MPDPVQPTEQVDPIATAQPVASAVTAPTNEPFGFVKSLQSPAPLEQVQQPTADDDTSDAVLTEPDGEPASPAASAAPAAAPRHPLSLIHDARGWNLTDEQINGATTDELYNFVREMNRRHAPQPAQAAPAPAADPLADFDFGTDPDGKKRTAEDFSPEYLDLLREQERRLQKRVAAVKDDVRSEFQREAATERQNDAIDAIFHRHAKAHPERFTNSTWRNLEPGSPEMEIRQMIIRAASGIKAPTVDQQIAKAIESMFGKGKSAIDDATTTQKQRFAAGGVAKPTNRAGAPEPRGREKAEQSVGDKMREMGMTNEEAPRLDMSRFLK